MITKITPKSLRLGMTSRLPPFSSAPTCEFILIPYDSVEQVFVLITINDAQKIILGSCYIF
jgi:hypothetical protein